MKNPFQFLFKRKAKTPILFNFRHIMDRLGIPYTNQNSWLVGQCLQRLAKEQGIEPERLLTKKTNPNPSVAAPHCIAHYPISLFPSALSHIAKVWANSPTNSHTQLQLF